MVSEHAGGGDPCPHTPEQNGALDYLSRKHLGPAASSSLQLPGRDGGAEIEEWGWVGMWKQRKKEDNGMNDGDDRKEWCGQLSLSDPGRPREWKGKSTVASLERALGLYLSGHLMTTTRPHNNARESPKQVHTPMWWLEEV